MKHVAEYWYFLKNHPIKVKIRDPAKRGKNTLGHFSGIS